MNQSASCDPAGFSDERLAKMLAALAHPARIRILRHLAGHAACNCKQVVGEMGLAQSTVSQHLKILIEAGLVACEPKDRQSRFFIAPAAVALLSRSVDRLAGECCAAEQRNLAHG